MNNNITISRFASLRPSGERMYNVTVRFSVGRDMVAYVICRNYLPHPEQMLTRKIIFDWVGSRLKYTGPLTGWILGSQVSDSDIDRAYELADQYFPELSWKK